MNGLEAPVETVLPLATTSKDCWRNLDLRDRVAAIPAPLGRRGRSRRADTRSTCHLDASNEG